MARETLGETRPGVSRSFEEAFLRLDVRQAVAVRQVAAPKQTLFYLSLFDDEIDARLEEFLGRGIVRAWTEDFLGSAALSLEPTDAVVIAGPDAELLVARGGANNFPLYWTRNAEAIVVSTLLPVDRVRTLSRAGLLDSLTVVSVANQNEPNLTLRTPLVGWFRCRRGAVSRLHGSGGLVSERPVDLAESAHTALDRDELIEALELALERFGRRLRQGRAKAVVELSGGFDSTIAAIAARQAGIELLGVSEHLPYYEFRFEEGIQERVASSLAISRVRLDGTALLSFAPSDWWPRLDEPSISVIRLKRALELARIASREGLDRILVGHGSDQLFAEDVLGRDESPHVLGRRAFSKAVWPEVERTLNVAESSPFTRRSCLTNSYDARLDVPLKEDFGTATRSMFTDLDWVRCGIAWSKLSARRGTPIEKSILEDAFAADLPTAVTGRRGKVPWDGVSSRAYAAHGAHIAAEIERISGPLEQLGLEVRWLLRRVAELTQGRKASSDREDKEVIGSYAVATWLRAWGVEHVTDCAWGD
jgi:hypothetical protein